MSSTSFPKSKAFKQREENAREKLRQVVKQDLVSDLSRLFGDTTFSDILFIVRNVEFQAHSVVLRARAPNFCRHFLPRHASPVSVQTCIQINGFEAAEFEAFLRSAYIDNDFKDYDEASYPWRSRTTTGCAHINHVVNCETHNGTQSDLADHDSITASMNGTSVQTSDEQEDATCTQSDYASDMSNSEDVISSNVSLENNKKEHRQRNNDTKVDIKNPSQCVSSCMCTSDTKLTSIECKSPPSLNNNIHSNDTSVSTSPSSLYHASQFNACDLVDGLNNMAVGESRTESPCQWTQMLIDHDANDACNGMVDGERPTAGTTCELTSDIENGFQSKQGDPDLAMNHTTLKKTSENDLECCSCSIGQDLLQILISEVGSDVTFLVNGGRVKAHKAILCARSNYFSAMLHGDWIEGKTQEIPLVGVNYDGLMTVLKYIYGGTASVKSDVAVICDILPLVDMYGLEGLREVIISTLKIEKCHLFHKPCSECIPGVSECLEMAELFSLSELKKSCIKWMAKHFDRVLGTKGFTTLPKQLQEEVLAEIQENFVISSAIEVLNHCDRLSSCTPLVKWTEPVHVAVSSIEESCLLFIVSNFFSLVDETTFHEILKGIGWSIPVLEKIISAVKKNLAIGNCCDQLRAILRLKRFLKLRATEEGEQCYPEEVDDLVVSFHNDCVKFIRCNLFKVTRSEGWKRLKLATQREIKEGAVFSGLVGVSSDRRGAAIGRNGPNSAPPSSRPPTRNASQRVGTHSRVRGVGRGSAANEGQLYRSSNQERRSSARGYQNRTAGRVAPVNKRPSSIRPSSAQNSASSYRGPTSSTSSRTSKDASEKKQPSSSLSSVSSGSSRMYSSLSRNSSGKRPSSASVSGRGKSLPPKSSLNDIPPGRNSRQRADKAPQFNASNAKNSSLLAREASYRRPLSAASSSTSKKSQAASKPAVPSANVDSKSSRSSGEKAFSVEGSRVQREKAPTRTNVQSLPNSRQCRQQVASETRESLASCNSSELSASTELKTSSSRNELLQEATKGLCPTTQANKETEQGSASHVDEKSQGCSIGAVDQAYESENSDSISIRLAGTQATSACAESTAATIRLGGTQATSAGAESTAATVGATDSEDNSLTLHTSAVAHCSDLQSNNSLNDRNDSLELD